MQRQRIHELAAQCGFELAGVARPEKELDYGFYQDWVRCGHAGKMSYLTDHRAEIRADADRLMPGVRSIICVGKLYNGSQPYSNQWDEQDCGWISRYAWGDDYHTVLKQGLERLAGLIESEAGRLEYKVCVDTAPLLERSYARRAGLGWIGKNTCLIREGKGSWFFLGELLVSLEIQPDMPPPDRCGSCTRCIDACPTEAIIPTGDGRWTLDSRLCISYFTIELRGTIPERQRGGIGRHIFGCDICQDVCPWNRKAPTDAGPVFAPKIFAPPLEKLAGLSEQEFKEMFRGTPVTRARYSGFLRNVAIAMGNAKLEKFRAPLQKLAGSQDAVVAEAARWGLSEVATEEAGEGTDGISRAPR